MAAGSNNIVTDGLIGCWDAGNRRSYPGAGTTWTDLAGSNSATLVNATFADVGLGVIDLDGTDDYVTVPIIDGQNGFSFSIWLYFDEVPTGNYTTFSIYNGGGAEFMLYIMEASVHTTSYMFGIRGAGTGNTLTSTNTAYQPSSNLGKWVHYCATYNGGGSTTVGNYKVYFNGQVTDINLVENFGGSGNQDPMKWGQDSPGAGYGELNGYMGHIAFYNRALSADEVSQNYEVMKPRFVPRITKSGLVGYWDAGDPQSYNGGTTWKDTANKNNATLENNGTNLNFNSANGGYFEFDGTDDSINLGSITSSNPLMCAGGPVSMCVWMYENSGAGSSNHPYIISKGAGDGTSGYSLMADYQGSIQVAADGQWCQTATGIYSDDEWIYVVGTVDTDGNMRAYLNGVYYPNSSHSETGTPPNTTTNMRIASRGHAGSYCGVYVAQVAIYNALLSDAEILDNYNKTKARFGH